MFFDAGYRLINWDIAFHYIVEWHLRLHVFGYYVICIGACYDAFASPDTSEEGLLRHDLLWQVHQSHYLLSESPVDAHGNEIQVLVLSQSNRMD